VLPVDHWSLLAPMTALNGVGWSTALIFAFCAGRCPQLEQH
jgi:hypothetical protein